MIVNVGPRSAAVVADEAPAVYSADRVDCEEIDADVAMITAGPMRAVVEILRRTGGLAPRALVGGIFTLPGAV